MKYELARLVEPRLAEQRAQLEAHGFKADTRIAVGPPPSKWTGSPMRKRRLWWWSARTEAPSLSRCLWEAVPHALIHHATLSILVVRMRMIDKDTPGRCEGLCIDLSKRMLFPTDFSDNAERAFTYVGKMAEAGVRHITILHVQDKDRIEPRLQDRLEEFKGRGQRNGK